MAYLRVPSPVGMAGRRHVAAVLIASWFRPPAGNSDRQALKKSLSMPQFAGGEGLVPGFRHDHGQHGDDNRPGSDVLRDRRRCLPPLQRWPAANSRSVRNEACYAATLPLASHPLPCKRLVRMPMAGWQPGSHMPQMLVAYFAA